MIMKALCQTSEMNPRRFSAKTMFFLPWYLSILQIQITKNKRETENKKRWERKKKKNYTYVSGACIPCIACIVGFTTPILFGFLKIVCLIKKTYRKKHQVFSK